MEPVRMGCRDAGRDQRGPLVWGGRGGWLLILGRRLRSSALTGAWQGGLMAPFPSPVPCASSLDDL